MIKIDGSEGKGGGQVLRTTLALVTGQPVRMEHIRAKRRKAGLLRQHLTAVDAARTVDCAEAAGAEVNSQTRGRKTALLTRPVQPAILYVRLSN